MADVQEVAAAMEAEFGVPGVLGFGVRGELVVLEIHTDAADALIAVQGAHVAEWRPVGQDAALWLSRRTEWARGKAIRGGVPVIWPWFGPRTEVVNAPQAGAGKSGSHGFARTSEWRLLFAGVAGGNVHLQWGLEPSEVSRAAGFDGFRLAYEMVIGRELVLRLTVANQGPNELRYEEALHTYLRVSDVERATISGLEGTEYLDKRRGGERRRDEEPVRLRELTDRVYLQSESTCVVRDEGQARELEVSKDNSRTTVVWNPWVEGAAALPDMEPDAWREMLCVESANVGEAAVRLAPGEAHTMAIRLVVRPQMG